MNVVNSKLGTQNSKLPQTDIGELIHMYVNAKVAEALDAQLPELLRSLGVLGPRAIDDAAHCSPLTAHCTVDPQTVAELLGLDCTTPESTTKAVKKVYYLARTGQLPSAVINKRTRRFDLNEIKEWIQNREQ